MSSDTTEHKHTNKLIDETSPYLLQHAHNPVNWYPWGEEALQKAKDEDKILLISIGYSACHWCHVMERESFEDEEVAEFMNKYFVSIKIDREERPDIDQIYMDAVQRIVGSGGWPLNCFALPDGKPFYGGTYFPKKNWLYLLRNIAHEYTNDRSKIEEYASELTAGLSTVNLAEDNELSKNLSTVLDMTIVNWKTQIDTVYGGPAKAPKFPLPNNYKFLMQHAFLSGDKDLMNYVETTLDKMANGGIYDQIGGGFSRYSTDEKWKAPHFEKMLYDNAQLVSLYSEAFRHFGKPLYKKVVQQSLEFIQREMTGPSGEFYSALDADSEGEEGKFYVWTEKDLQNIEGLDVDFTTALYSVNKIEMWENEQYILQRLTSESELSKDFSIDAEELKSKIEETNKLLFKERSSRIRPGLDDKTLTSWNALMISGYVDAYKALNESDYLKTAISNANFIWEKQKQKDGSLFHNYKKGRSSINAFLEDYACVIEAYLDLYEVTFEREWIEKAEQLAAICQSEFYSEEDQMFYFTSIKQTDLITRKLEILDNVIPASNSTLAHGFYRLGLLLDNSEYTSIAKKMLNKVKPSISVYGSSFSNWALLLDQLAYPFYEIAVVGEKATIEGMKIQSHYLPNSIVLGSKKSENLPLLDHKYSKGSTKIYVCVNKACQLPVESSEEALKQITYK